MLENIAEAAIAECRALLQAPSRAERWWQSLRRAERLTLLRHAELDKVLQGTPWLQFPPAHRQRLVNAARRAAGWGKMLCKTLDSPVSTLGEDKPPCSC
jgi:hypothetical protein